MSDEPIFKQDVFRTTVEFGSATVNATDATVNATDATDATVNEIDWQLLKLIQAQPAITYTELSEQLNLHRSTIARHIIVQSN